MYEIGEHKEINSIIKEGIVDQANEKEDKKPVCNIFLQKFAQGLFPFSHLIGLTLFLILLKNAYFYPLMIIYILYILLDPTSENGGRSIYAFRNLRFWHWYSDYFPAKLILETQLDANYNYILGYHPHGILAIGALTCIMTNGVNSYKKFKNIDMRMATIPLNFAFPFSREVYLSMGMISCSKKALLNLLGKEEKGKACVLAIGGAAESLYAKPGKFDLVLNNRYGFIKVALETGSHLVPVINFGENYLAGQVDVAEGSIIHQIREFTKSWIGITIPLYFGSGFTDGSKGYMPRKVPLITIVGKPIPVKKDSNPSMEKVKQIHNQYVEALKDLYERNAPIHFPKQFGTIPPFKLVD